MDGFGSSLAATGRLYIKISMKNCFRIIFLIFLTNCLACAVSKPTYNCLAPAASINAQVYDLCLLKFSTDDIAHPKVQECYDLLAQLPNDCDNRILIKRQRCARLIENRQLQNPSLDECISSVTTEGYFVKECQYPFSQVCLAGARKQSR